MKNTEIKDFPEKWIVNNKGELVELGNDINAIWGFTISGMKKDVDGEIIPIHSFYRSWRNIDEFLNC